MAPLSALLWRHLRVHQIYGANTDVGKTIVASILCNATSNASRGELTTYLKPVSTGPDSDSDSLCLQSSPRVSRKIIADFCQNAPIQLSHHKGLTRRSHISNHIPSITTKTLFQYGIPCSPHTAAKVSGKARMTASDLNVPPTDPTPGDPL